MLVLGLQGSPRKKGNTDYLLTRFMEASENLGARTHVIDVPNKHIVPCIGCGYCEEKGHCVIQDDDMTTEIYSLLRSADIIVAATPMYFYSTTAQLKALIDRSQTLWARKYRYQMADPGSKIRRGFFLALGATKGKNLFNGVDLTIKYFFDAVSAEYTGSLTYRQIESPGDMKNHPTVEKDIEDAVNSLLTPLLNRKKILFACRENACRSQMAAAYTKYLAGDRIEVFSAGNEPAAMINSDMVSVMEENKIDMAFQETRHIDEALSESQPDMVITMGCEVECPMIPGVQRQDWDLPDPAGQSVDVMRGVRDRIEENVQMLVNNIETSH